MREEMALREQSTVYDRISVKGILLENKVNQLRNFVHLDDYDDLVKFTTWRAFDTADPLDTLVKLDAALPLSIASGQKDTTWEQRTDFGQINLFLHSTPLTIDPSDFLTPENDPIMTFEEARIKPYETHGIWCLIAWFPLGFALLATQRYYKTRWYAMFHLHNLLGLLVTILTVYTCMEMYAYGKWSPTMSVHSVLGLIALILVLLTGGSGIATSAMMMFYNSDPEWADRDKVYNVAMAHRYISYFMLIWGNSLVVGGTWTYL